MDNRSIGDLIKESEKTISTTTINSVQLVADNLTHYLTPIYKQTFSSGGGPPFGLFIGGFDLSRSDAVLYAVEFPKSFQAQQIYPTQHGTPQYGLRIYGDTKSLLQLFRGYDNRLIHELNARLGDKDAADLINKLGLQHPIDCNKMSISDAVDIAACLIQIVGIVSKSAPGGATCGGPTDIAVVTTKAFTWARGKHIKSI